MKLFITFRLEGYKYSTIQKNTSNIVEWHKNPLSLHIIPKCFVLLDNRGSRTGFCETSLATCCYDSHDNYPGFVQVKYHIFALDLP